MATVGTLVSVGSSAPETGRYKHTATACTNTIILNKGNVVSSLHYGKLPRQRSRLDAQGEAYLVYTW
jgi:hypothetical protein